MNTYWLLGTSSYFTEVVVGAMPTLAMPKKALPTVGVFSLIEIQIVSYWPLCLFI